MIRNVSFGVLGVVLLSAFYVLLRQTISAPEITKKNYSGRDIPTLGGLVVLVALLAGIAIESVIPRDAHDIVSLRSIVVLVLGFSFVGLVDDLVGDKTRQGFKGHIKALINGQITTGAVKLFGGPAVAAIACAPVISGEGYGRFFLDVVTISLIANLFNLFDLSPGRTSKFALIAIVACLAVTTDFHRDVYVFFGVLIGSLILDVREKYMLGDTGANLIGAMIGYCVVSISSITATAIVGFCAFLLNIASEFVSFSRVIDKLLVLRLFDEIGQTSTRKQWTRKNRAETE